MKKACITFLLLLASMALFAQTIKKIYYDSNSKGVKNPSEAAYFRYVKFDADNKPVGKVRDFYISGRPEAVIEGALKIDTVDDNNSVFIGNDTSYYESGGKKTCLQRNSEGMAIAQQSFYESGKSWFNIVYTNGTLQGMVKFLYENGNVKSEINYVNGKKSGVAKYYTENGKLKEEATYYNNVLNGSDKVYDMNGIERRYNYINGKKNGTAIVCYFNGKTSEELNYVNDTITGVYKMYYINQSVRFEATYVEGKRKGSARLYSPRGKVIANVVYDNDTLNGAFTQYWDNGKVQKKGTYTNGGISECSCFDSVGNGIDCKVLGIDSLSDPPITIQYGKQNVGYDYNTYISQNIKYPETERRRNITGTVFINFIVERDGSISNVRILKGVADGPGLDKEAVRVVKSMPKWNPVTQNGKLVRASYYIPIIFVLN